MRPLLALLTLLTTSLLLLACDDSGDVEGPQVAEVGWLEAWGPCRGEWPPCSSELRVEASGLVHYTLEGEVLASDDDSWPAEAQAVLDAVSRPALLAYAEANERCGDPMADLERRLRVVTSEGETLEVVVGSCQVDAVEAVQRRFDDLSAAIRESRAPATMAGCEGAVLLETPEDPSAKGPWAVGALTTTVGRLKAEVWYPAPAGSVGEAEPVRYDVREALPPSQREVIPDEANPWQVCDCYRDLPLDTARGPYPVVVFVHGTASFRTQSLSQMEHWASRGFVVVAADHPGLMLGDTLTVACPDEASGTRDLKADVDALLAALAQPAGDLAFLEEHLDLDRVALVGHSAGGRTVAELAGRAGVRVVVPMAAATPPVESDTLAETLFLAGTADAIVPAENTTAAFEEATGPRRLGVLEGAPHLAFSDLCTLTADDGRNLVEVAQAYEVCGTEFASLLFDCAEATLDLDRAAEVVTWLTTAVLEQHLQCRDRTADLDAADEALPELETWRKLGE